MIEENLKEKTDLTNLKGFPSEIKVVEDLGYVGGIILESS